MGLPTPDHGSGFFEVCAELSVERASRSADGHQFGPKG